MDAGEPGRLTVSVFWVILQHHPKKDFKALFPFLRHLIPPELSTHISKPISCSPSQLGHQFPPGRLRRTQYHLQLQVFLPG